MKGFFTSIISVLFLIPAISLGADLCVQLKWSHQSQFAGLYVAKEEGYYRAENINVRFVEGGPHINWQKKMKSVQCPVGITNAHEIVTARSKDIRVKAVAAIAQVSPIVFFSLKESGITDPRQFRGRKIALASTGKIHLRGILLKVGLPLEDVIIRPFSLDMSPFYSREVDVWSGYITNLVTQAESEGYKLNIIHPVNYGIQIYDDILYSRTEFIEHSPALLEGFLRATFKGWMKSIREPALAVDHTLKYAKQGKKEHELDLLKRTIPYIHTGEVPIGWMENSVWEEICILTKESGLADSVIPVNEVFTDRFLLNIYEKDGEK